MALYKYVYDYDYDLVTVCYQGLHSQVEENMITN